ncbi:transmembrane protein 45B [Galendromus occidentalis]|uniref:Transmembrane protein 45B n=1 Tax=Galendromus occidentalis TaxID=34638 RepID=A0AAJ7L546_9ACAR|nr:transmembrane protein 45B [Galendromus occidentalis]
MGSFIGHFLPGFTFTLVSLWWMLAISAQQAINPRAFRNRASHPWPGRRLSPETWLKIIISPIGIIGEAYTAFEDGRFSHLGNLQHMTMYTFFLISGIIDLWSARKSIGRRLPPGSDFAAIIVAAMVEWLLFRFHLHGRDPLDVLVHTLLGFTIVAIVLIVLAECVFRESVLLGYMRAIAVLTHGLWFISVGYILHNPWGPPPFDANDHGSHMVATCIFTWHVLVATLICGFIVVATHKKFGTGSIETEYTRCPEREEAALKGFENDDF